ncbi:N-acetyllactosaminide beta-1,3-N-acetylglucosaminyltransferase 3-like [Nelusetta ayraudi]|uniref:N-acetyllactosaminide beta-1,3-N-acetylglucosaminyltransferase 3-like n=1 Tax=Nelusetta ayraudi TaxID=303726 RepID=UPI003F6F1120
MPNMLRQIFITRSNKKKVALLLVLTLWLFYLARHGNTDSVGEEKRKISQSQTKIGEKTPKGQMCQQNMSAANITGFDSFPPTMKDFVYYRHCRYFPLLLDSPDKCGHEVFLLLVIKSAPGNYERREVLRKTWAKERQINGLWVRRIFISGTTGDGPEKVRMDKLLELEQQEHNDIIQWDFKDAFINLTLKQALFLEWLDKNCPHASFLLNGDDDVFAHTDNMVEYLQSLNDKDGSRHLFTGFIMGGSPIRESWSKYYVPFQVQQSNSFPLYCSGGGYLLSRYTASVIHKTSRSIPNFPIDDVYMGMCLAKARLKPSFHAGVKPFGMDISSKKLDELDPCFYKDILLVHRFLPTQMFIMWHRVNDPDLKCGPDGVQQ